MSSAVELLDRSHYFSLQRAISNAVNTNLAVATYAQIIDGLPTEDVAWDRSRHQLEADHPLSDHVTLCPGVIDRLNSIKGDFQIGSLNFNSSLLEAFQSAKEASRNFNLRLLELTAVALHQIAVHLFQLKANLHDRATTQGLDVDSVVTWKPEPEEFLVNVEPFPTLFAHSHFTAHEQYPNGVADMVGYWAEDRILGGVAIFDRSKAWNGDDEPNIYFQSCRKWATWRVWQLLPEQQDTLVKLLLQEPGKPGSCTDSTDSLDGLLPLMPSRANTVRIDPLDAIPVRQVYRDAWEREPPPKLLRMQRFMAPCVVDPDDYPEMESGEDQLKRLNELYKRNHS